MISFIGKKNYFKSILLFISYIFLLYGRLDCPTSADFGQ